VYTAGIKSNKKYMKKFLAVYMGSPEALATWRANGTAMKEREKDGMDAWMKWATDNKSSIVDNGAPLGKTKRINADGISDIKNEMGAYTIVEADSHEAAAKLFLNHPHFMIFPGDRVEVMECLSVPGM
jgi:hypothetical protein